MSQKTNQIGARHKYGRLKTGLSWEELKKNQKKGACGAQLAPNQLLDDAISFSFASLRDRSLEEPDYFQQFVDMGRLEAEAGNFPSLAAIVVKNNGKKWLCSGSVLSENWIVTSASCVLKEGWDFADAQIKAAPGVVRLSDYNEKLLAVVDLQVHPDFDFPKKDIALVKTQVAMDFARAEPLQPACFGNEGSHASCFPTTTVCASVGLNRNGKAVVRPVQSMHFSKCKNEFEDESIDPLYFGSYFTCAGSREITENKICDWRPGGAMLYCRRPDGPWIVSGIESLPESCSRKGEEVKRPALFSTIESSSDWLMTTAGMVSDIHPYICGRERGDITMSQAADKCGRPVYDHTEGLLEKVSKKNAPADWYEMMKEVYETHPEFKNKKNKFANRAAKNDKVDLTDAGFENIDAEEELVFEADLTPRFHNNTKDIVSGFGRSRGPKFQSKPLDLDPSEEDGFWNKLSNSDIQQLEENQGKDNRFVFDPPVMMGRVIGGNDAQPHSWPWQIFLSFDEWDCGAIMIHPTWLLTAAHCIPGQKWKGRSVIFGLHNLERPKGARIASLSQNYVTVHPNFHKPRFLSGDPTPYNNDIALVRLRVPLQFDDKTSPACLPSQETCLPDNTQCVVSGWGNTNRDSSADSDYPAVLQEGTAPVNILNNDFCANPDPWEEGNFKNLYYRKMYSHNMVCAGHEKGFMDACQDQRMRIIMTLES
ncbi:Oidioi.mRNA.OKI2018_I69.chr1.g3891.t1.cds [Oikopleura dioica]|uniref:Oidioi.mRNA.OKI2018_I69.chr1.g3891.t1.cds n=1 Tax=Oikopleura dioica TaxID=34765 RepID=A0ABN7T4Q6_OIKDI|nr:Oidioi.mRNA.OKI2018_I69.chr1.g3891.t1.cds [Oikopleura dioica]